MTKQYEVTLLFSPELSEADVRVQQDQFEAMLGKLKGKVISTDPWGRKPLAYTINKHTEAYYVLYVVDLDASKVTDLDREIRLTDNIIRHLVVVQEQTSPAKAEKASEE